MSAAADEPAPMATRWVLLSVLGVAVVVGLLLWRKLRPPPLASGGECRGVEACDRGCQAGDGCACGALGSMYLHGSGTARDAPRGAKLLETSCDAGCPTSCWALANAYQGASGVKGDKDKANQYFAKLNAICEKGCDDGDPDRCFTLAATYVNGRGVSADPGRAKELYTRSADAYRDLCDRSNAHACARLAVQVDYGLGTKAAKPEATALYEKACALGDADACEDAAKRFDGRDKDLPADPARATALAKKACAAGLANGCSMADEPASFLRIVDAACAAGSAFDCGSAAYARVHGNHGVAVDLPRASEDIKQMLTFEQNACTEEDPAACAALARPFETGTAEGEPAESIVQRDPALAAKLKKRACDLGFSGACNNPAPEPKR